VLTPMLVAGRWDLQLQAPNALAVSLQPLAPVCRVSEQQTDSASNKAMARASEGNHVTWIALYLCEQQELAD
jgi:hypothetical protein